MDSFRHFWMGLSSFGCNDNFYCYVGAVLHSFKAIAFPIPRLSYDLYRFEVKDFKTDMISNELWFKRQKSPFHVSFGVLFFCNHIHPRPSKRSYRTRKKGKNKQTQGSAHLPKSAASLSNKISAKIFKMAPVTINDPNGTSWQSRSFEETDRSEIERKLTCSIIELLLSEASPGYDLLKMTIVFVQLAFELELREGNTGNIPFATSSKREG